MRPSVWRRLRLCQLGFRREDQSGARDSQRQSAAAQQRGREKRGNATNDRAALGESHRRADDELLAIGVNERHFDEPLLEDASQTPGITGGGRVGVGGDGVDAERLAHDARLDCHPGQTRVT